jgi:hypothetical protein
MTDPTTQFPDRRLTTPRTAAIAGVIYSVLSISTFTIINLHIPSVSEETGAWLETSAGPITIALALVPFAGIAFLWFMGVLRDRIGLLEDKFFSTLFLGSGLLYLGLVFSGAAMAGGLMTAYGLDPTITDSYVYVFARAVMYRISNVYSIRMAGMFMTVLATIWVRTGIMPRLLGLITYAVAAVLLLSVSFVPWMSEIFPVWVLLVSIAVLILNFRGSNEAASASADREVQDSNE